jgi:sigma-54 specific flagellar transcriptional regulator A
LAQNGSIFLDEIGDLPLELQVKLLRVLQERVVDPVGSTKPVPVDVRVIAATHRDLEAEIAAGRFREDLYYRLNVLPCHTTPLRERPQDVQDLLDFYAARHAMDGCEPISFAPDLLQALLAYAWPGNVRELSNLVDRFTTLFPARCVTLAEIPLAMLPPGMRPQLALSAMATSLSMRSQAAPEQAPAHPQPSLPSAHTPSPMTAAAAPAPIAWGDEMIFTLLGVAGLPPAPAWPAANAAAMTAPAMTDWAGDTGLGLGLPSGTGEGLAQTCESGSPADPPFNRVEEIVCLAQGIVSLPPEGLPLKQQLTKIERSLIEQALLRTNGNVSQTARLLQLQRTTLIEKIQKYELRVG